MIVHRLQSHKAFFVLMLSCFLLFPESGIASILFVSSNSNAGPGSLREQVELANPGDTIRFNIDGIIRVDSFIRINKDLVIEGPGFDNLTIDGQDKFRIFQIERFQDVKISKLQFRNANSENLVSTGGAAIQAVGNLTLTACLFEGNVGEYGGAIHVFNRKKDTLYFEMVNCSFINNKATVLDGGAINMSYADFGTIHAKMTNCVFTENSSTSTGGAINLFGQQNGKIEFEMHSCTIVRNEAPFTGGINSFIQDTIRLYNTILAENSGRSLHPNGIGNIISGGYNLVDDTLGFSFQPQATDILGISPGLGPLIDKGEWIPSVGLLCGSPAIDQGSPSGYAYDVRGLARDASPDIGAHERIDTWDKRIYSKEDGRAGSLRLVLEYACPGDTLFFDNIVGEVHLDTQIVISKNITLMGNRGRIGTKFLNEDKQRFFVIENNIEVAFHYFSFWGGNPTQNGGGAILNKGQTHIYNSTFAYNSAISGGALANYGDGDSALMVLINCTFSNNEATTLDGGAIDNYGFSHPANLVINHCTLIKNRSKKKGGAIYNNDEAETEIKNTIIAQNQASMGPDTYGNFNSLGHNLWLDTTSTHAVFQASDLIQTQPELDSFAYYGGSSYTYRLKPTSPAIDAGDNENAPLFDQRGFNRLFGASVDIGSYEYDPATAIASSLPVSLDFSVYPNPCSDRLWIDFPPVSTDEPLSIAIYALDGKCVYKQQIKNGNQKREIAINISAFPAGLYILIGTTENRQYHQKVVFE